MYVCMYVHICYLSSQPLAKISARYAPLGVVVSPHRCPTMNQYTLAVEHHTLEHCTRHTPAAGDSDTAV